MSKAVELAKKCNIPKFMRDTPACQHVLERFYHEARAEVLRHVLDEWDKPHDYSTGTFINRLRAMADREGK